MFQQVCLTNWSYFKSNFQLGSQKSGAKSNLLSETSKKIGRKMILLCLAVQHSPFVSFFLLWPLPCLWVWLVYKQVEPTNQRNVVCDGLFNLKTIDRWRFVVAINKWLTFKYKHYSSFLFVRSIWFDALVEVLFKTTNKNKPTQLEKQQVSSEMFAMMFEFVEEMLREFCFGSRFSSPA